LIDPAVVRPGWCIMGIPLRQSLNSVACVLVNYQLYHRFRYEIGTHLTDLVSLHYVHT
jgi:hypothetical protein